MAAGTASDDFAIANPGARESTGMPFLAHTMWHIPQLVNKTPRGGHPYPAAPLMQE